MPYRKTSTKIKFDLIDKTAAEDAAYDYSHSPICNGCDIDKLSTKGKQDNYMTNEHNYSLFNSSKTDLVSFSDYAFISNFSSNSSCTFDSTYYLRITFNDPHTVPGITIHFDGDYLPDRIRVVYYDSASNDRKIIASKEFSVDESNFYCKNAGVVENFKEIRIYFLSTKFPNSIIKMSSIVYGASYLWDDDNIIHAEAFQESDIISNTLSIGTCRFTLYSDDDDFNIDNPNNIYAAINKNQKVEVYETITIYDDYGVEESTPPEIFIGQYYLKNWVAQEKHNITFECVDLIGVLDDITFYDSKTTYKNNFGTIISWINNAVYENIGIQNIIQLQNGLSNKSINGILPVCTCREALQMACFAVNGYATCNRRRNIYVSKKDNSISHNISNENNFGVINSNIKPLVTGIKYPSILYISEGMPYTKFFEGDVSAGNNQTIIIDNVVIPEAEVNIHVNTQETTAVLRHAPSFDYAHKIVIDVATAGKLVIDGYRAEPVKKTFIKNSDVDTKIVNIIDISNINLYQAINSSSDDIAIIDDLLKYYSKRHFCEYEFLLNNEEPGNWCLFQNMYDEQIRGNIFSMVIDLTGGFTAKVKLVCCENLSNLTYTYVCGNDVVCGEDIGII